MVNVSLLLFLYFACLLYANLSVIKYLYLHENSGGTVVIPRVFQAWQRQFYKEPLNDKEEVPGSRKMGRLVISLQTLKRQLKTSQNGKKNGQVISGAQQPTMLNRQKWNISLSICLYFCLTLSTPGKKWADDSLYFSYFPPETGFDISRKLSQIAMKCQILFSWKNKKKNHQFVIC